MRADTLCGGTKFWLHNITDKIFSVSPFSASYDPMKGVKIDTCLTAYTYEYGRTWIILFNEVLWFGTSMDHSIINPNQIWMAGIPVLDGPLENSIKLGITHEKVFVPFSTYVRTVYLD